METATNKISWSRQRPNIDNSSHTIMNTKFEKKQVVPQGSGTYIKVVL